MLTLQKEENYQVSTLSSSLKRLESEQENKIKAVRKKEILQVRAEINGIENRENKWSKKLILWKINNIDKTDKGKREDTNDQ